MTAGCCGKASQHSWLSSWFEGGCGGPTAIQLLLIALHYFGLWCRGDGPTSHSTNRLKHHGLRLKANRRPVTKPVRDPVVSFWYPATFRFCLLGRRVPTSTWKQKKPPKPEPTEAKAVDCQPSPTRVPHVEPRTQHQLLPWDGTWGESDPDAEFLEDFTRLQHRHLSDSMPCSKSTSMNG